MIKIDVKQPTARFSSAKDVPANLDHDGKIFVDSAKRTFISAFHWNIDGLLTFIHVPDGDGLNLGGEFEPSWPLTLAPKGSKITIEN